MMLFIRTKTQHANFQGNPLYQAKKTTLKQKLNGGKRLKKKKKKEEKEKKKKSERDKELIPFYLLVERIFEVIPYIKLQNDT